MLDDLLLLSKRDIPFAAARITIHNPTLDEISLIGEEKFFFGLELLNFSKEKLVDKDREDLEDRTNFEILMSIMKEKNGQLKESINGVSLVLMILFPRYEVSIQEGCILLIDNQTKEMFRIDGFTFDEFQSIIREMFNLNAKKSDDQTVFNPVNAAAKRIADKIMKGRQAAAKAKGEAEEKISILNRYVSILSIGLQMDFNIFMKYTVYQLYDAYERFSLKQKFDMNMQARLAGAKDLDEVDNWMKNIHP